MAELVSDEELGARSACVWQRARSPWAIVVDGKPACFEYSTFWQQS